MRYLPTLMVGALVIVICGSAMWRAKALSERASGVLTSPVEQMAADWEAKKIPQGRRVVTILLSDVRAAADPFMVAPEPEGGLVETAGGWIRRNLIGADAAVQSPTELGRAFADSSQLVRWTHNGYSGVSPESMSRELEKAILKAHDAGAEINIVAQGEDAAPALMALKRLEGVERGGVKVGANKVMLLGMEKSRFKRIPSVSAYAFSRPGNVLELASVWVSREEMDKTMRMQVFGGKRNGEITAIKDTLPGFGEGSDSVEKSLRLLRQMVESADSFDQAISKQEQALMDAKQALIDAEAARRAAKEEARRAVEEEARRAAEEEARRAAEEEAAKRAAEAAKRAAEAARRAANARKAGITWVPVPGGSFMMGSDAGKTDEKPIHRVTVEPFEMSKTEVTNKGYRACVEAGACAPAHVSDGTCMLYFSRGSLPLSFQGASQPVVCVNWEQAKVFAEWVGGRLPTEAEWEYAARSAGRDWKYPWGNGDANCSRAVMMMSDDQSSYGCGRVATWPVCSKTAGNTQQGLCDMAGNVAEWTQDWHHDSYNGAPTDGSAWESPTGSGRVFRGGSLDTVARGVLSAFRFSDVPGARGNYLGLRPARD